MPGSVKKGGDVRKCAQLALQISQILGNVSANLSAADDLQAQRIRVRSLLEAFVGMCWTETARSERFYDDQDDDGDHQDGRNFVHDAPVTACFSILIVCEFSNGGREVHVGGR